MFRTNPLVRVIRRCAQASTTTTTTATANTGNSYISSNSLTTTTIVGKKEWPFITTNNTNQKTATEARNVHRQRQQQRQGSLNTKREIPTIGVKQFSTQTTSTDDDDTKKKVAASDDVTLATTQTTTESERLAEILRAEIKHEHDSYEPSEVANNGPPDGWELSERDGDCQVYLSKTFGNGEEIMVHFLAADDPLDGDYETDEDVDDGLVDDGGLGDEDIEEEFSVTVMKNGGEKQLDFLCVTDGEVVRIKHVRYEGFDWSDDEEKEELKEGEEEDEEAPFVDFEDLDEDNSYPGPHFEDLDKGVQDAFLSYLEERGINSTLADYIVEKRIDKEQQEYTNWLDKVANFLK